MSSTPEDLILVKYIYSSSELGIGWFKTRPKYLLGEFNILTRKKILLDQR